MSRNRVDVAGGEILSTDWGVEGVGRALVEGGDRRFSKIVSVDLNDNDEYIVVYEAVADDDPDGDEDDGDPR